MTANQLDSEQLDNEQLELEVKQFLIDTLGIDDRTVDDIDSDQPLFGDGLGLDSVDALEIGVGLQKTYGIKLDPKDAATREYFASVRNLARLIAEKRGC